jgi:hypothetical protein
LDVLTALTLILVVFAFVATAAGVESRDGFDPDGAAGGPDGLH